MKPWRHKLHEVIFEADTAAGRWFDTLLIISILISVGIVMLAVIFGAIRYVIEGAQGGFTSSPRAFSVRRSDARRGTMGPRLESR